MQRIEFKPLYEDLELSIPQRRFLVVFLETCSVVSAARAAKIHRRNHVYWMNNGTNKADYREAFRRAEMDSAALLEHAAIRRAVHGTEKPVFHKGKRCGVITEYSDRLMEFLLSARDPDKYARRHKTELSGSLSIQELDSEVGKALALRDSEPSAD